MSTLHWKLQRGRASRNMSPKYLMIINHAFSGQSYYNDKSSKEQNTFLCAIHRVGHIIYYGFYNPFNFLVSKPNKIKFLHNIGTYFNFLKSILILYFLKITSDKWAPCDFVYSRQRIIILFITASNVSWSIERMVAVMFAFNSMIDVGCSL